MVGFKPYKIMFLVFFLILFVISCEKESEPSLASFQFPTAVGNYWKYAGRSYSVEDKSVGGGGEYIDKYFDTGFIEIISREEFSETMKPYKLETDWYSNGYMGQATKYVENGDEGFFEYESSGSAWIGPPKINSNNSGKISFNGKSYSNLNELLEATLHMSRKSYILNATKTNAAAYEDYLIQALAYPLVVGNRWVYRSEDLGDSWDMDKKIISIVDVTVPAGKFTCFKIKWYWDINGDGKWDTNITGYDYLAPIGYVKREFNYYGLIRTNEYGDPLGTFDATDLYELIDYHINDSIADKGNGL